MIICLTVDNTHISHQVRKKKEQNTTNKKGKQVLNPELVEGYWR